MFKLEFSEKIDSDIVGVLKYISEALEAPRAAEDHFNELIKVLLYRFLYNKRDWTNILSSEIE